MKKLFSLFFALLMLCGALAGCASGVSETAETPVRLVCLNIGKADCMLLLYGEKAYLIDAGYEQTYPALETALKEYGVARLNGVFLTHCHKDHMGGLIPLSQSGVEVDAWYAAALYWDVEGEHPAVTAANIRGQQVSWLEAGDTVPVSGNAAFSVLGPLSVNIDNENNNSLVMKFSSPQGSILFAGDMKEEEESELIAAQMLSPCELLKVGHHGDNNATSKDLLRIVRPKAAVILTSTQEESDTPAPSTIRRLEEVGADIYVSQDAHDAYLFTLTNGQAKAEDVLWSSAPARAEGVSLQMDVQNDTLTIVNGGTETLSLSGCALFSTKGDDTLLLPEALVSPGEAFVVGSKSTDGQVDAAWPVKQVWHKKKRDMAILYDPWGRAIARTDNGIAE